LGSPVGNTSKVNAMKIPKTVIIIGRAHFFSFMPIKGRASIGLDLWNKLALVATNKTHSALYIFPENPTGKESSYSDPAGLAAGHIHKATEYKIPTATLKAIGTARRIIYDPIAVGLGSNELMHQFDGATVYGNRPQKPSVIAIKKSKGNIYGTSRGIM